MSALSFRHQPPRYEADTNSSERVDAFAECDADLYAAITDDVGRLRAWIVTGGCNYSGPVQVYMDRDHQYVWECPKCKNEHRDGVTA